MPTSLSTRRGTPPFMGTARMEEEASRPPDFGVEIYRISDPSGVTLGCESCSSLATRPPATGSLTACLNISGLPFRSELKRTALLSNVQDDGILTLSSRVSLLLASR